MTSGDVATSSAARSTATTGRLSSARAPFQVLALMMVASAAMVGFFYAFPGTFEVARHLESGIAVALLALAALVAFVAPRLRGAFWLDVCVITAGGISAYAATAVPHSEGQLTIAIGLLALGVFTAYYRSSRRVLLDVTVCCALWLGATMVNPLLSVPFLGVVYCVIIVGTSYAFSKLVTRLRDQALHDNLTGLLNRHGLSLLAGPVVAGARRSGSKVTVCVLDVDRFKQFNDTFGHLAGDRLLVAAADAISSTTRDSDLVVRWGGDEIVVLLVGTSTVAVQEMHDRALEDFATRRPADWQHGWTWGCTTVTPTETVDDAIARADADLLTRKRRRLPDQRT